MDYIDLRSDTVTRPSSGMLDAMRSAEVGDDVFGEDPTVNSLQKRVSALFGKEDSLFVPSGTMGNQLCIKTHTEPGDEVIVEQESHVFLYETGAPGLLSGVQIRPLPGLRGILPADGLRNAIRPRLYYYPPTKLICLENTHGRSAGSIYPLEAILEVAAIAKEHGIALHLDGARIWNAHIATGVPLDELARNFDSLSVCFSKGLGAPIGSVILGSSGFIAKARRFRKIFGGGMRQVGILAAAAHYAIDHNLSRLREDHKKASHIARELESLKSFQGKILPVETNMVIMECVGTGYSQEKLLGLLRDNGILLTPEGRSHVRAVTHMDVSMDQAQRVVDFFRRSFK